MKSDDLYHLSTICASLSECLEEAAAPLHSSKLTAQPDELHATYLSTIRNGVQVLTANLKELHRQAEVAGHLWEMDERMLEVIETMKKQEADLRQALHAQQVRVLTQNEK